MRVRDVRPCLVEYRDLGLASLRVQESRRADEELGDADRVSPLQRIAFGLRGVHPQDIDDAFPEQHHRALSCRVDNALVLALSITHVPFFLIGPRLHRDELGQCRIPADSEVVESIRPDEEQVRVRVARLQLLYEAYCPIDLLAVGKDNCAIFCALPYLQAVRFTNAVSARYILGWYAD